MCISTEWQTRLQELQEIHQIHGHCRVPQIYPHNPSLGNWVSGTMRREFKQRENGKESWLTVERIAALNNLGFDWVVINEAWEIRLEELREFYQTSGHCRVPQTHLQNASLGMWVSTMVKEFRKWKEQRKSVLMAERIAALNNLWFWPYKHCAINTASAKIYKEQ